MAQYRVGIIGGTGQMGKWFKRFFERHGYQVEISSRKTSLTPLDCAKNNDIVIVSVPIQTTLDVIKEIAPHVKKESLLMDLTSIKEDPVKAMLEHSKSEVIGCHPVFGPSVSSMKNQAVVLCPARGKKWLPIMQKLFETEDAKVKISSPEKHDEIMAIIQGITHFNNITLGHAIKILGADIKESLEYASPIYKLKMDMVGRILNQDAGMYADIEIMNPKTKEVIRKYVEAIKKLQHILETNDREGFIKYFKEASDYFGSFKKEAEEYSNYTIEKLVERK